MQGRRRTRSQVFAMPNRMGTAGGHVRKICLLFWLCHYQQPFPGCTPYVVVVVIANFLIQYINYDYYVAWTRPTGRAEARGVTNEPQSVGHAGDRGFAGGISTIRREGRPCVKTGSGGYVHGLGYVRKRVPGLVIRPDRASPD